MIDLGVIRWELAVTALALAVLIGEISLPVAFRRLLAPAAAAALGILLFWSLLGGTRLAETGRAVTAGGIYVLDPLALWAKRFAVAATALSIVMSARFLRGDPKRLGDHVFLQLTACLGMMLAASAADFLSLFIAMELMAVSFYVLVAFQRENLFSLEAGVKYLIYGALSSGVMLYGMVFIYGATGRVRFDEVAVFAAANPDSPLLMAGVLMLLAGVAFKISAVPFHWWTPDVYEGAPLPTAALLAIGSKGAGFVVLVRLLTQAFPACDWALIPVLAVGAGASILFGNLGGLSQGNLKRLMGYSSISHSGFLLLGLVAFSSAGISAALYYLVAYLLGNALVFIAMCETAEVNPRQDIRDWAGFAFRSPWIATALAVGLVSLAGIPPLGGFFGKLLVFRAAWTSAGTWLLTAAVIGAVAALFYYLGVVRVLLAPPPNEEAVPSAPCLGTKIMIAVLVFLVFLVGFYPAPWWRAGEVVVVSLRQL